MNSSPHPEPPAPNGSGGFSSDWRVELWPNRSLSRAGLRGFLALLAGCFGVFFLITAMVPDERTGGLARVLPVIILFVIAVFACVCLAFAANNRAGRYIERLMFDGDSLVIEARYPDCPVKRWKFQPFWTRVSIQTTRTVENDLILRQGTLAVAIGRFLTPDERSALADEIRNALRRFNCARA